MPESVRRGLADLDRQFFEGKIGLEDYMKRRKRIMEVNHSRIDLGDRDGGVEARAE